MDITNYFHPSERDKLDDRVLNSTTPGASQISILSATREMNSLEYREEVKKKTQVLPEKFKKDLAHLA